MQYSLYINCENCGNQTYIDLKNVFVEHEGKVYEDYSSITDSFKDNEEFIVKQHHPDTIDVTCMDCGQEHELTT